VDFIAIDLDKYDVWEAFRQPVPIRAQMYVKTANWNPSSPSEEVDCPPDSAPGDVCYADDQEQQQTFGQASPTFGNSGTGPGPGSGHQDPGSNQGDGFGGGDLTDAQKQCAAGQTTDRKRNQAAKDIAAKIAKKSC